MCDEEEIKESFESVLLKAYIDKDFKACIKKLYDLVLKKFSESPLEKLSLKIKSFSKTFQKLAL